MKQQLRLRFKREIAETQQYRWLIAPENDYKAQWDIIITSVLMFSCVLTPLQMALFDELSLTWEWINNSIDIMFFIDMIIIFNTATYDDDFLIITDRKIIAVDYLKSWFTLDLFCIVPFDYMVKSGNSTNIVRLARIGRINKIIKLMKLIRLTSIKKKTSQSCMSSLSEYFHITAAGSWFFMFFAFFCLTAHIIACIWLIAAKFDTNPDTWLNSVSDMAKDELYLTSFYFTITTITTVGYGDWSANTFLEKIVAIIIMFIGVIAFSFASGTLTNYIQQ